jgi:CheY-like chemotaxis protein
MKIYTELITTSCRVLLIDDDRDIAALISAHLTDPRITLKIASGGREGINTFKDGSIDLVLMDIQMPETDGYEATRAIRFWESRNNLSPTPIAALTSFDSTDALSEIFNSGCTTYLHKPISRNVLLQTVSQYFRASQVAVSST